MRLSIFLLLLVNDLVLAFNNYHKFILKMNIFVKKSIQTKQSSQQAERKVKK